MKNIKAVKYKHKLDHLFEQIKLTPFLSADPEIQSHWSNYLCILVSGFIEVSVGSIFSDYAKRTASPKIANFVESNLNEFQNPKMEKILSLTGRFSKDWQADLRKDTDGDIKDAIDSIVANRNAVAHGKPSPLTIARVRDYYIRVIDLVELIEKISEK